MSTMMAELEEMDLDEGIAWCEGEDGPRGAPRGRSSAPCARGGAACAATPRRGLGRVGRDHRGRAGGREHLPHAIEVARRDRPRRGPRRLRARRRRRAHQRHHLRAARRLPPHARRPRPRHRRLPPRGGPRPGAPRRALRDGHGPRDGGQARGGARRLHARDPAGAELRGALPRPGRRAGRARRPEGGRERLRSRPRARSVGGRAPSLPGPVPRRRRRGRPDRREGAGGHGGSVRRSGVARPVHQPGRPPPRAGRARQGDRGLEPRARASRRTT